jgi:hypothetical protein
VTWPPLDSEPARVICASVGVVTLRSASVLVLLSVACASGRYRSEEQGHAALVFAAPVAEGGKPEAPDPGRPPALAPATLPELRGSQPDPPPLRLADQWQFEFVYDSGVVSVERVQPVHFRNPVVTARRIGRYAVELWIGRELVDRVRFDFPLLAAEDPPPGARRSLYAPPSLSLHAQVRQKVLVPASGRARRALFIDRATEQATELAWPPDRAPPPGPH